MFVKRMSAIPVLLLALGLLLPMTGTARGGDFTLKPRISTTAEYNDNVSETHTPKGDYLWIVKPGVSATYEHSRVLFDLSYDFEHKKYLDQVREDEDNHYLNALANVEAIKDLFFIDATDTYQKVYQNATRGDVEEGDTTSGTTNQNTFGLKPYFVVPLRERTSLTTGGEFKDIWYSEEDSVDKRVYDLFADVDHELSETWTVTGGVGFQKQDPRDVDGGFERYNLTIGTKYSYAEGSFIEARWEPTYTDFKVEDSSNKQYNPYLLGITHAFTPTLVGSLSTAMEFTEDPESAYTKNKYIHQASLTNAYERGKFSVELAYYDYENDDSVSRSTYWRPSVKGTHNLSERLSFNYNAYVNLYTNPDSEKTVFSLFSLRYSLSERTWASLSYRFKMNDEQTDANDYTSNSIGLTIGWSL